MKAIFAVGLCAVGAMVASTASAQKTTSGGGQKTVSPIMAVDATGKVIGRVLGDATMPVVLATIGSANVALPLGSMNKEVWDPNAIGGVERRATWAAPVWYYAGADCLGELLGAEARSLILTTPGLPGEYAAVYVDYATLHRTLYFLDPAATVAVQWASRVLTKFDPGVVWRGEGWCENNASPDTLASPAPIKAGTSPVDLNAIYTPPFVFQ